MMPLPQDAAGGTLEACATPDENAGDWGGADQDNH
jgi:hypothetical protein